MRNEFINIQPNTVKANQQIIAVLCLAFFPALYFIGNLITSIL